MNWQKLGRIFSSKSGNNWFKSHTSNPYAIHLDGDIFRVFFSSRDHHNRSHITWIDIDLKNKFNVINVAKEPAISPGSAGLFDDSGCSMGSIIYYNHKYYLYYTGWNLRVTVPWQNSIGLAISESIDGPFVKAKLIPVLDRNEYDLYSLSYPFVLSNNGLLTMYYGSNLSWGKEPESMHHVIKSAISHDGHKWQTTDHILLDLLRDEIGLSRPCVVFWREKYRMWYSIRRRGSAAYKLGYAFSDDGIEWIRDDKNVGLDVSKNGFDDSMICYPHVFRHDNMFFMLYNGNNFGESGIGIATLQIIND